MLEHLIYVNTWFPKYEVDHAEQTHYTAFKQNVCTATPSASQAKQEKTEPPKKQEQKPQLIHQRKANKLLPRVQLY